MNTQIFENIRTLKRRLLPNERMILFGSQARGDYREDSDWDLLVLLNKNGKITSEEDTEYGYPFEVIGWEFGVAINTIVYSNEDWEKRTITPFYKNVKKEGIEIK